MALAVLLRSGCRNHALIRTAIPELSRTLITPSTSTTNVLSKAVRKFNPVQPLRNSSGGGSHVTLWSAERALSLGLLGIVPVAIAYPSQAGDALLAISIVAHSHWGLEAIVVDYVRPIIFGNVIPKVAHGLLLLFSAATLGGLFYFIHNDIGIGNAVHKFWAIKSKQ